MNKKHMLIFNEIEYTLLCVFMVFNLGTIITGVLFCYFILNGYNYDPFLFFFLCFASIQVLIITIILINKRG